MRTFAIAVTLTVSLSIAACSESNSEGRLAGGDDVGNGGNPALMAWFQMARSKLITRLSLRFESKLAKHSPWLAEKRLDIRESIEWSELQWTDHPQKRCGSTTVGEIGKPIYLYFLQCKEVVRGVRSAAQVLIHEAIHQSGIVDEQETDRLTFLLYNAIPETDWYEEDGILNFRTEADFICEGTPEDKWKATLEYFNGAARARLYRRATKEPFKFLFRFTCTEDIVGDLECSGGDSNYRLAFRKPLSALFSNINEYLRRPDDVLEVRIFQAATPIITLPCSTENTPAR